MEVMSIVVDSFNVGAKLVHEARNMTLDQDEVSRVEKMRGALIQRQLQAFPLMRQKFGPLIARKLWVNDIEATTKGGRYSTIEFVGGRFAAHRDIEEAQTGVEAGLKRLRFNRSQYKWIPSEGEFTFYPIDSPADDALAFVSETGDVTLRSDAHSKL